MDPIMCLLSPILIFGNHFSVRLHPALQFFKWLLHRMCPHDLSHVFVSTLYLCILTLATVNTLHSCQAARRLKLRNLPEFRTLSGGTAIELAASKSTDPQAFEFPMVMAQYRDCNFSMAGIKNCVRRHILQQEKLHGTVQLESAAQ